MHPRNAYLPGGALLPRLVRWLGRYFAPHRRADTVAAIVSAQGGDGEDTATVTAHHHRMRPQTRPLPRRLGSLGQDGDPAVTAGWSTETQQQHTAAEARLRQAPKQVHMRREQITDLIDQLGDKAQAVATADPARKADLYGKLGLHLTYHPTQQRVRAEAHLDTRTL